MKKNRPKPFIWLLLVTVMVLPGCLEADRVSIVIYDSGRDVFRRLRLYSNIASGFDAADPAGVALQSKEYDYLQALWKNRHDLIPIPEPFYEGRGGGVFDRELCLLYVSNHAFRTFYLSDKGPESTLVTTPLSLDDVSIKPGKFFQSSRGTLCYYHQTEVPGKTLDRLLLVSSDALCEYLVDAIPMERLRRQKGGNVLAWNLERHKLRQAFKNSSSSVTSPTKKPDNPASWNPGNPASWLLGLLDDNSLRWLLSKAASRELKIKRNKYQLEFQLILSSVDARELVNTAGMLTNLANDTPPFFVAETSIRQLRARLSAITFKDGPEPSVDARYHTVSVQLDLVRFLGDSSDSLRRMIVLGKVFGVKDSEKTRKRSVAAVKEVALRGIPVGDRLNNLDWLFTAFRQGTLK